MAARADPVVMIDPAVGAVPVFEYWRPTRDWAGATLFRLLDAGIGASIRRAGDDRRGAVAIVLAEADDRFGVLAQVRIPSGRSVWVTVHRAARVAAAEAEAIQRRAVARDPDLWLIEIDGARFASHCVPPAGLPKHTREEP